MALTDATEANGCPQVARGLHRRGTLAHTDVEPLGDECLTDADDVAVAEVGAGGSVVFSSLTPHLTGPNMTDAVRKAYVLQYAPVGATILGGDPSGPATERTAADDPDRQFPSFAVTARCRSDQQLTPFRRPFRRQRVRKVRSGWETCPTSYAARRGRSARWRGP